MTYKGNISEFVKLKPEAKAYYTLAAPTTKFRFPNPGLLDGINNKKKPVLRLRSVSYKYPGRENFAVEEVSGFCSLSSRIGVVGVNGAGKSTLIKSNYC